MSKTSTAKAKTLARTKALPDAAAMEAYAAARTQDEREAAVSRARDLVYEAMDRTTARARKEKAIEAIAACPLCADAYSILAAQEKDVATAASLYRLGLKAGELALGPDDFEGLQGEFWGFLEARPYMRARQGLALALLDLGEEEEAAAHMCAMLASNPGDNQGIRYLFLALLVRRDERKAVEALLEDYADEWGLQWLYTRALVAFRKGRTASKATHKLLKEAFEVNAHVPAVLSATDVAEPSRSGFITAGGRDEAVDYAEQFGAAWRSTAGAVDWLAAAKTAADAA